MTKDVQLLALFAAIVLQSQAFFSVTGKLAQSSISITAFFKNFY